MNDSFSNPIKHASSGLMVGLCLALLTAVVPTVADWLENPGEVFRGQAGTHWDIVLDTWFSWFWPFALIFTSIAVLTSLIIMFRRWKDTK